MDALPPPAPLVIEGNVAENWKKFQQRFRFCLDATGVSEKGDRQQTSLLLHVIGDKALEVYNTFHFDNTADAMQLTTVLQKFENYCAPKTNLTLERFHFNNCNQEAGEGIDSYLTRLKKLGQSCEFGELRDSLVKDRLVCGITDNVTRERLLRQEDLTLEKAEKVCKAAELVKERSKELSGTASTATVHAVRQTKKTNQSNRGTKKQQTCREGSANARPKTQWSANDSGKKHHCRRCDTWHVSGKCPAWSQICGRCKGKIHYARCCLTRPPRVDAVAEAQDDIEGFDLDSVTVDSVKTQRGDWICPLVINGSIVPVKLDTGAQVNILSEADYRQLRDRPRLHPTNETLKGYCQGHIPVKGKCIVTVKHGQDICKMAFFIVPGKAQPLLGRAACERLKLIKAVFAVEAENTQLDKKTESSPSILKDYPEYTA